MALTSWTADDLLHIDAGLWKQVERIQRRIQVGQREGGMAAAQGAPRP